MFCHFQLKKYCILKNCEIWDDPWEIFEAPLGDAWDLLHRYNINTVKNAHFTLSLLEKAIIISISLFSKQLKMVNFIFLYSKHTEWKISNLAISPV